MDTTTVDMLNFTIDTSETMKNVTLNRPPGDPSTFSIVLSAFLAFICLFGLIGNFLVVFVIIKYTKMKTVTNMYILNLSISDGLFLLGLPLAMGVIINTSWPFGAVMCKIYYIQTCVNWFTGTFTLVVMSFDRFLAVCYPIQSMRFRTPKYALILIVVIWIVSIVAMLPIIVFAGLIAFNGKDTCNIEWPFDDVKNSNQIFILYVFLLGFVIPVALISVFYILLLCRLRASGAQIRNADRRRSHRKVTKLVTLIIVIFIVCWLPYWSFQVYNVFRDPNVSLGLWPIYLNFITTILSYANSMVNPILYAFTNENFRESFISAFKCAADPILGASGRRWSEYVTGNNNSVAHGNNVALRLPSEKRNADQNGDYEFTMLTSNSNSPAGNSTKKEDEEADHEGKPMLSSGQLPNEEIQEVKE